MERADTTPVLAAAAFLVLLLADAATGDWAAFAVAALLLTVGTALTFLVCPAALAFALGLASCGHPVQTASAELVVLAGPAVPAKMACKGQQAAAVEPGDLIPSWTGQQAVLLPGLRTARSEPESASEAASAASSPAAPKPAAAAPTIPALALAAVAPKAGWATGPQTPDWRAQLRPLSSCSVSSRGSAASADERALDVWLPLEAAPAELSPPAQLDPSPAAGDDSGSALSGAKVSGSRVLAIVQRLETLAACATAAAAAAPSAGSLDARSAARWRRSVRSLAHAYEASVAAQCWQPLKCKCA